MAERWISYLRVSTGKQGKSGLGLEAQRTAVNGFLNGGKLGKEFIEVETGKISERPKLEAAFAACRLYGAKLLIAKLDRLSRDAHFLLGLEKAGIDFIAADMPFANRLTIGVMALVAEEEGRAISRRTKEALAAAKKRGIELGGQRRNVHGKLLVIFEESGSIGQGDSNGGVQRREPQKWPRLSNATGGRR